MKKRQTKFVAVPPLSDAQLKEAARVEQMILAWKALAILFPTETARWLAARSGWEIEIESACVVDMKETDDPHLQLAPDESEPPLGDRSERALVADLVMSALQRNAPAGTRIEQVDTAAIERECRARMSKLPFPVILNALCVAEGQQRRTLIGLALPAASEDGTGTWQDLLSSVPWFMEAYVNLELQRGRSEREARQQVSFFTVPVYVWHGSGILDPEELDGPTAEKTDVVEALFGRLFERTETDEERNARRTSNRKVIARRSERDRARRRAAEHRQAFFGDPMITEEQLRNLHVVINDDAPQSYGLHLHWTSVRLWEQDGNELARSLPVELLGLAMLAAPGQSTREELLDRCLWRLRKFDQRAAFERHLIPLVAMARVWIADDWLSAVTAPFHRRFLE